MGKNTFKLDSWLNSQHTLSSPESYPQVPPMETSAILQNSSHQKLFYPAKYLIPGWEGTGLISIIAVSIQNIINELWKNAIFHFKNYHQFTKSMKISIYDEFHLYIDSEFAEIKNKDVFLNGIDNLNSFWKNLADSNSVHRQLLDQFIEIYCFRAVIIYVYKIRLIKKICSSLNISLNEDHLLSPNSFINKIFKKGSSSELFSHSVQKNQYSWFRPSYEYRNNIFKLSQELSNISITELMKICTHTFEKQKSLKCPDKAYSHSLSHLSFGNFINDLFIRFPKWLNREEDDSPPTPKKRLDDPEVLNCKYRGDYLSSISLAHWLAQKNALNDPWDKILCPDFVGEDFSTGDFNKICHELQFLTFLVEVAEKQNHHPITLICNVMKKKSTYSPTEISEQLSIFNEKGSFSKVMYNRIFCNFINLPKKNPHHFLIQQILSETETLKRSGFLFISTNQNLFVPSQSERVEQLLSTLKVEAIFNFENIKGKGEIPNYIYVFSKKAALQSHNAFFNNNTGIYDSSKTPKKESCLSFRWNGELKQFNHFCKFVTELRNFFHHKNPISTAIFSKDCSADLSFEFHQDAIMEGKLLNSCSNDPNNITHPNFFKNLTKSCLPLNQFFYIESLNHQTYQNGKSSITSGLLGITLNEEEKYPIILIVNQTNPKNIQLELIQSETYQAKREKYGTAFFQYFGLIPKVVDLNINLFRDFFQTNVGSQIVQLSLNGGYTKLKSKLRTLLIPKFFLETTDMPDYYKEKFGLMQLNELELLQYHPADLESQFEQIKLLSEEIIDKYPWQLMGIYSHFNKNLERITYNLNKENNGISINFKNPILIEPLLNAESFAIYPKNEDVFVDFFIETPKDVLIEFTHSKLSTQKSDVLELWSGEKKIIEFHSDKELLFFINFILSSAVGYPVSQILQNLSVPKLENYKSILKNYLEIKDIFISMAGECETLLRQIITRQVSAKATVTEKN